MPETAINTSTFFSILPFVKGDTGGGFQGPSIVEFFPDPIFFANTPFELNRIMLIRILVTVLLVLVFVVGTRNLKIIPGRGQVALELVYNFVRDNVVIDVLGELKAFGYAFEPSWFAAHRDFRFPLLGDFAAAGGLPRPAARADRPLTRRTPRSRRSWNLCGSAERGNAAQTR